MSFKQVSKGLDDKLTVKMTTSTISSKESIQNDSIYEDDFTLMAKKTPELTTINKDACLAYNLAQKYPRKIQEEVTKIVDYY